MTKPAYFGRLFLWNKPKNQKQYKKPFFSNGFTVGFIVGFKIVIPKTTQKQPNNYHKKVKKNQKRIELYPQITIKTQL
jgi:hypothetical protein